MQIIDVDEEKEGSQDRALGNPMINRLVIRVKAKYRNVLFPVFQV